MKALVTGGAGFIGSHVADALLAAGHEVHVLDSLVTGRRDQVPAGARFIQADLADSSIPTLWARERYAALIHLAAQIDVRHAVADPVYDARINVLGMIHIIEAGLKNGLEKVVFSSSGGAIYGEAAQIPTPESAPEKPLSPYGVSKLAAEKYLAFYAGTHGLSTVSLRYANVYGPRQTPEGDAGVISRFVDRMRAEQPVVIFGDGLQTRDYVYVGDVVRANLRALERDVTGSYNVGTGRETSVRALYGHLARALGRDPGFNFAPARLGEVYRSALDTTRAGAELGWAPEVDLETGLARTVAWFDSRAGHKA